LTPFTAMLWWAMNAIRKYRKAKGMTLVQLAEKLELSPSSLSRWETGKKVPAEAVKRVAEVTGLKRKEIRPDLY
jgi:transcriptional regulator with XRE-family HTH domain